MSSTLTPVKKIVTAIGIAMVLLLFFSFGFQGYLDYQYNNAIDSYFDLADQSSTLDKKEMYLVQYAQALKKEGLDQGNARYFWKTPYTDLTTQYSLVETLIERLKETQKLDPKSFEYQKAIEQITEQEFGGFDRSTFYDGWLRQSVVRYIISAALIPFLIPSTFILFFIIAFLFGTKLKKTGQ